jgi:polysaccharide biosynthesis protein PslG
LTGRAFARLVVGSAVLVLALVSAAPALAGGKRHPARGMFGFTTGVAPWTTPAGSDFRAMHHAHLRFQRFNMTWAGLERYAPENGGSLDLSTPDAVIGAAAKHGVQTMPVLWGTPSWATGCRNPSFKFCWAIPPTVSPKAKPLWIDFVQKLVSRYGRNGSFWAEHPEIHYQPVKIWQIWNEPNLIGFFSPEPDPKAYADLVHVTADAIHNQDPKARIALAGIAPGGRHGNWVGSRYLKALLRVKHIGRWYDVAAVHAYYPTIKQIEDYVGGMAKILKNHTRHKPLWVSEQGWSSLGPSGRYYRGLKGQAKLVKRTFKLYVSHKFNWHLGKIVYFAWRDLSFCEPGCWGNGAGFHYEDGRAKPSWKVFHKLMKAND